MMEYNGLLYRFQRNILLRKSVTLPMVKSKFWTVLSQMTKKAFLDCFVALRTPRYDGINGENGFVLFFLDCLLLCYLAVAITKRGLQNSVFLDCFVVLCTLY
jgi:hypothetical protein